MTSVQQIDPERQAEIQRQLDQWLKSLPTGAQLKFPGRKTWQTVMEQTEEGRWDPTHFNQPTPGGDYLYFLYTSKGTSDWGDGRIVEEPSLWIPVAQIDELSTHPGLIIGIMVPDEAMTTVEHRYSLTNAKSKSLTVEIAADGQVFMDGQSVGYAHTLFESNKNRLIGGRIKEDGKFEFEPTQGFIMYCSTEKPAAIQILEVEDMVLMAMRATQAQQNP